MKAYQILIFLLIFNMMIWAVDAGLHIYDLNFSGLDPETEDADLGEKYTAHGLLASVAGISIILVVGSLVSGAIIGSIIRVEKASQAYVYGAFTAVFWFSYTQAINVFWNITSVLTHSFGALVVVIIFTAVIGYIFLVGLFQMVTGGWKSYV